MQTQIHFVDQPQPPPNCLRFQIDGNDYFVQTTRRLFYCVSLSRVIQFCSVGFCAMEVEMDRMDDEICGFNQGLKYLEAFQSFSRLIVSTFMSPYINSQESMLQDMNVRGGESRKRKRDSKTSLPTPTIAFPFC